MFPAFATRPARRASFSLGLALLALAACATPPGPDADPEEVAEYRANNDPLEPLNRKLFAVHQAVDGAVLAPVARAYRDYVPGGVRTGIRNAAANLRSPALLANDMLQARPREAGTTLGRFVVNTTVGVGGVWDAAAAMGMPGHSADFGQTLALWGVAAGPYLFVPLLGPSGPRDLVGRGVDYAADPLSWVPGGTAGTALRWSRTGVEAVSVREGLLDTTDEIQRTSMDPYATIRSGWQQQRAKATAPRDPAPVAPAAP